MGILFGLWECLKLKDFSKIGFRSTNKAPVLRLILGIVSNYFSHLNCGI